MLQSRIFVGMVLILIFGEVLGLYGYDGLCSNRDIANKGQAHRRLNYEHKNELSRRSRKTLQGVVITALSGVGNQWDMEICA